MSDKLSKKQESFPIMEEYLAYMEAIKGRSPLTVKEYRYDLRLFFRFLRLQRSEIDKDTPIDEIPIDNVDAAYLKTISLTDFYAFLAWLARERNSSAANRARKVSTLRGFFSFCTSKRHYLEEDPTAELESPKLPKTQPEYLTLEQSKRLLEAIDPETDRFYERNYCIVTLFLNCGLRLSELCNIDLNDLGTKTLKVTGKGNKERTIYLNNACINALDNYLDVRPTNAKEKDALFISRQGNRLAQSSVQRMIKKYMAKAGLDVEKFSTHKLRHTAATLMYQYGDVDIRLLQDILGHESISTTEIYTHLDEKQLEDAVASNPLANEMPEKKHHSQD